MEAMPIHLEMSSCPQYYWSLVNQKREAIISYCEKRASRISTIEAKKKKRGDTVLNELNET